MNSKRHYLVAVGVLLLAAGASCSAPEKAYPAKRQYALDVPRAESDVPTPGAPVLKVRRFDISERFEGTEFVYRIDTARYETDFYNVFLTAPAALVTEEVRRWLAAGPVFAHAIGSGSVGGAGLLLEGNIEALCGDFSDADAPRAVMAISFTLIDDTGPDASVAFHKSYRAESALADNTAGDLVRGWNACLAEILTSAEADLRDALAP